ncbi:WxL domain-containing protein [Carnobacterium gallinarum]|uniref:WxL domain-containing protein n=1 Tax=Carnobacterium gallinarum TaxID=2749 RepID=UPI00055635D6|nr:WxL domain-containing protein [Carnobacterium gallinarum]
MKRTKLVVWSLVTVAASSLIAPQAFAGENGDTVRSVVDIEYITNTNVTKPTDPTAPGNEIKPNPENPGTGNSGPLSLDYVSKITFGQQKSNGNAAIYYAINDVVINKDDSKKVVPNYLQVTDNRGNNAGWILSVKQDGQLKNTTSNARLGSAELSLLNSTVNSANTTVTAPTPMKSVVLKLDATGAGVNSTVVTAVEGTGSGTWTSMFGTTVEEGMKSIQLSVPAGTKVEKGAYTTSLVWTLSTDAGQ